MFGRQKTDEVGPPEVAGLLACGAVLLHVRADDEWAEGHAPHRMPFTCPWPASVRQPAASQARRS
jgi:rhodanese-related sulfurtransferase